jgi:hypothetical protein
MALGGGANTVVWQKVQRKLHPREVQRAEASLDSSSAQEYLFAYASFLPEYLLLLLWLLLCVCVYGCTLWRREVAELENRI